jgi:UDP-N-acetyl-D-mannosaminuronic acid dehydrogenase
MSVNSNSVEICVVGMGYVGTALSAVLADKGARVHGIDIDSERITTIERGNCPIEEDTITDLFEKHSGKGAITATTDYEVIGGCDTILVTVGTPLAEADPDISAVKSATQSVAPHLNRGDIVIYRSTLPATLTEDVIMPLLNECSGLKAGEDYALAFCPERMAEGNAYEELTTLPVIVGGYTQRCRKRVESFWEQFGHQTVPVSNPTAAELAKLADNWWIDLNIALANEVALLSEKLGVNAMEVIHAANTLPKGEHNVNILFPGAGVGGSCLVKDPWFVANLGEQHELDLQTPRVSRNINNRMPGHMVDLVEQGVGDLTDATVAVLGYAFKSGTDDTRNTPAAEVVERLQDAGADVRVTDPFVPAATVSGEIGITPVRLPEALVNTDAIVLVTDHEQYCSLSVKELIDYVGSAQFAVIDGRFAFDADDFTDQPVTYIGLGQGSTMAKTNQDDHHVQHE